MSVSPGSHVSRALACFGLAVLAWSLLSGSLPVFLATLGLLACVGVLFFQARVTPSRRLPCMELLERLSLGGGCLQAVRVGNRVHLLVVNGRDVTPLDVMPAREFIADQAGMADEATEPAKVHPRPVSPSGPWREKADQERGLRARHCVVLRSPFAGGADVAGGMS